MSTSKGRLPTLADVARAAGVSVSTASKALADRYDVKAATKERVRAAADELGFTPNELARGLLSGRTQSVGIVTSDLDGRFAPKITVGAEDALGADRSSVILCISRGDAELERHHVRELLRRRVDGLLIVGDEPEPREPLALKVPIPVVYVYAPSLDPGDVSFVCDNESSGRLAARHFIDAGRSRIVHLGGPEDRTAARDRARGTAAAVRDAGLELVGGKPLYGPWSEAWGWDAVARLLDEKVPFDAVVGGNDQIARGVIDQLDQRGVAVPDDVAVIGFDNWSVVCHYSRRPFTSVDLNLEVLGRSAAQAVMNPEQVAPGLHPIAGTIVERESSPRPLTSP